MLVSFCAAGVKRGGWGAAAELTSSPFDDFVEFVAGVHGAEIELFDNRPSIRQLRSFIRRRSELLKVLPPHAGGRLLHPVHGTVSEITLYE